MTHNRKACAVLFFEPEYEDLIVEAYSKVKVATEKLKNGRHPFSCVHCHEVHQFKNMTSYHRRFNLYKVYINFALLKMYSMWEKSDHGKLSRLAKKY